MATYLQTTRTTDDGVVADVAPDFLRDVVLPSGVLSNDQHGRDYRHLCAMRIEGELARDQAALRLALGEGRFAALVRQFLVSQHSIGALTEAPKRFTAFLRNEVERDPALWIARAVALRRGRAFRRMSAGRRSYPELARERVRTLRQPEHTANRLKSAPGHQKA
jgi:hypothetical protein